MRRRLLAVLCSLCLPLVNFSCATAPREGTAPEMPSPPGVSPRPAADRFRAKAERFEEEGDLRRALRMWEVVGSLSPDEIAQKKTAELKARIDALAEEHFRKGESFFRSSALSEARREFLSTLLYNPDHRKALVYLKEKLAGEDVTLYEVRRGDTLAGISQKLYGDPDKEYVLSYFNDLGKTAKLTPGMMLRAPRLDASLTEKMSEREDYPRKDEDMEEEVPKKVDTEAMISQGQQLLKAKKYREALAMGEKVLEQDKKNARAAELVNASSYQIGTALSKEKKYREALRYLSRVDPNYRNTKELKVVAEKQQAEVHYVTGVKYFVNEDLQKAIQEWEAALLLNPAHPKAKKDIENARSLLKKLEETR